MKKTFTESHLPPVIDVAPPGEAPFVSVAATRILSLTRTCGCGLKEVCIVINKDDPNTDGMSLIYPLDRPGVMGLIKMLQEGLAEMAPKHEPEVRRDV